MARPSAGWLRALRRPQATEVFERSGLGANTVALTFDDGPAEWTVPILDSLRTAGVHATFFVVGDAIPGNSETLKRAAAEGHEIANHALTHRRLDLLERDEIRRELLETGRRVEEAVGAWPTAFRAPYFSYDKRVLEVAAECGYDSIICASVYTLDFAMTSDGEIADAILSKAMPGSIIALHDGRPPHDAPHATGKSRDDRWPTVRAVERIVPSLLDRGFEFATVTAFLAL